MKTLRKLFVLILVLSFATAIYAEKIAVIKYTKGNVLVKSSGGSWKKAEKNMKLEDTHMIKTEKNGMAQLKLRSGQFYKVMSNKTMNLKDIAKIGSSAKKGSLSKLNALKSKLGKGGSKSGPTAVAGVRGADVSKQKTPIKPSELIWEE
jgi:hypothetical protein